MKTLSATAQASPNIAFIKYWGNRDSALRLPVNGSVSMNLDGLFTRTSVSFQPSLALDELVINGRQVAGKGLERVSGILDLVRQAAGAAPADTDSPASGPTPTAWSTCARGITPPAWADS